MGSRYVPCPVCRQGFDSNRGVYVHAKLMHPVEVDEYLATTLFDLPNIDDGDWGKDGQGQQPIMIKDCGNCGEETEDPVGSEFCGKCGYRVDLEDITYGVLD